MSTWNDEQSANWIVVGLALFLFVATSCVQCAGPCSWLMWEPVTDLPARCLPGTGR
jgi:hypothetical protein